MRFFKSDPVAKLEKQYVRKLEQARDAQRNGRLPVSAELSAQAEALGEQLDAVRRAQ